ncbi:MAG: S8 family serine peptidase [Fuerstiella sp.]|nr:S8 family serine peptidase [Fuerstiella sp.]
MKSVSEMMRFLNRCFSTETRNRRYGVRSRDCVAGPELMEARLLLAADLSQVLYDPMVLPLLGEDQAIDSYFVAFDAPQSQAGLQQITGATSVTESAFVPNAYTLDFSQDVTVQQAADAFSILSGFVYLNPNVSIQHSTRAVPNDPLYTNQWHLNNTGQNNGTAGVDANIETAWDTVTGQGVTIGIIDDGLEVDHEDLAANVNTAIDFDWNGGDNDPSPGANDFHGTAVGGVAAAVGNNNLGVTGAAWDAELVGLRLIAGPSSDQDQAEALTHESQVIDIYNNSWGPADNGRISSIGPQALAALEQSTTSGRGGLGTIHTWAGGNGGDNTNDNVNYDPYANSRHTIAVGALTNSGVRASYSDPGASLVVVAHSNGGTLGITTTDLTGNPGYSTTNYASDFGGTSSATPLVSGVIALMLEANPILSYRDVTDILATTAERVDPTNADWVQNGAGLWVNHEYGFGGIDATAAVNSAVSHVLLGPEQTFSTGVQTVDQAIPDAGGGSVTQTVNVAAGDAVSIEYVQVIFSATHTGSVGELDVVLTSPSGTQSILAQSRSEENAAAYSNWSFTSTRHWDESSEGDWTVTVTDSVANNTGNWGSFEINFFGSEVEILPPVAPQITAPTGTIGDTTPTIQWTAVPNGATYNLEVNDAAGAVVISQQAIVGTSYSSPVLSQGTYSVRVQAVNVEDEAGPFSQPSAFTVDVPEPASPTIISPKGVVQNLAPLAEWSSEAFATTYDLQVSDQAGSVVVDETGITTTSFQLPQLLQGTYQIRVSGVNEVGETSPQSLPTTFQIDFPDPPKPTILNPSVDTTSNAQPEFRWTTENATTSTLWVGKVRAGTGTPQVHAIYDRVIYVTEHYGSSYTWFSQLPGEGQYAAWVRTFNAIGERSPWSDPEVFTLDVPSPTTPVLASIGTTDDLTPTITWDAQTFGHSYQLWVNNLSTGQPRVIHEVGLLGVNSFTPTSELTQGRYRAWVQATNAAGEKSAWSQALTFEVDLLPAGRPTVTGPVTLDDDGIVLAKVLTSVPVFTWTAVNNGETYELWVNHLDSGTNRIIHETTLEGTSFTATTDLPQGNYRAWVRGFNKAGEVGEWSSVYKFFVDVPTPAKPTITQPVRNAVGSVETLTPTIVWTTPDPDARYHLQFEATTSGELLIDTTGILTQQYTVDLILPEAGYRARVRGENSVGELGEWSDWYDIRIDLPNATTPVAFGPVGTVTDKDNQVTFEWLHSPDSVRYQILVRDLLRQESIAIQVAVNELNIVNNIALSTHTLQNGTFRFWVQAFNAAGTASGWSNSQAFTVDSNFASLDTSEQTNGLQVALTSLNVTLSAKNAEADPAVRPEAQRRDAHDVSQPISQSDDTSRAESPISVSATGLVDIIETVMAEFADPSVKPVFDNDNAGASEQK